MVKEYINPSTLFPSEKYGFSQIVTTQGSRTVYLSGQAAFDAEENVIGTNHKEQMQQCLKNIEAGMEAVGGSLEDVVSLRIYVVDYDPDAESDPVAETLKQYFKSDRLPAATLIGVSTLAVKGFLVEIEATAVLE
ncbi:RidA family protein [Pleurocapsales cyanobacterium LEGE 10410]|nr:RidA family protein [Pleurocapsales cyanobacterium LEGE 10410]